MAAMTPAQVLPFPPELRAAGTGDAAFEPVCRMIDVPPGSMLRVTRGDLDVLVAHTPLGLVATDDRCPHMAAPLSVGQLEGCIVACPLHRGRFDLSSGEVVRFPTTGGLDAEGRPHDPWTPPDSSPKPVPSDEKARARALTRVRRLRFYPLRIRGDDVEVALPR
jgi:nitrite reductase/ring-hydroxylating ferredoxin subunit